MLSELVEPNCPSVSIGLGVELVWFKVWNEKWPVRYQTGKFPTDATNSLQFDQSFKLLAHDPIKKCIHRSNKILTRHAMFFLSYFNA